MSDRLNITVAQINPAIADPAANAAKILQARDRFPKADLMLVPDLALQGGRLGALQAQSEFRRRLSDAVDQLTAATSSGPALLIGTGSTILLLQHGRVQAETATRSGLIAWRGLQLGVVCGEWPDVPTGQALREQGASLLIHLAHSPFGIDRPSAQQQLSDLARACHLPAIHVNRTGAQDELVFAGGSCAANADGQIRAMLPRWLADAACWAWDAASGFAATPLPPQQGREQSLYQAMVLALREYVGRNGFPGVLLGFSGGIDSALSAAVAVDALGPKRVRLVMLPSRFTSSESLTDAAQCADMLGVKLEEIAIEPAVSAVDSLLQPFFAHTQRNLAEENIQARLRMVLLMGLSNKFGHMLMATSNKSELAVGYSTIYGDGAGGYNVLKDVYKTDVFRLSRWRNAHVPDGALGPDGPAMPDNIITKPPTAELRDNQLDADSLPPYDVLDPVLEALIADNQSVAEITARGLTDQATAARIESLLLGAEYKRRQAPPGAILSAHSLSARDYPMTNPFRSGS